MVKIGMVDSCSGIEDMDAYFRGECLYGDDLSEPEISNWYRDEGEGYANLGASDSGEYRYVYHALNWWHGYRGLSIEPGARVLGFGSAYGEELLPVLSKSSEIFIIDPSDAFVRDSIHGVPCRYVKPIPSGALPFEDATFDLATAFGVLHHVPNVTAVMHELARVMRPNGLFLLREPVVSMGDWRYPRVGLTKHERGIPLHLLRDIVEKAGFTIERQQYCVFPPLSRLFRLLRTDVYNSRALTLLDAGLSWLLAWNLHYHPKNLWQKIRPTSVFLVLRRNAHASQKGKEA